jgi:glycosyltransferase involved in cell wall biosynthesis
MKVLMWMAAGEGEIPGGHQVQLVKTAEALREAGIAVQTATAEEFCGDDVDLVHGFGLSELQITDATRRKLPVVLSPIYWSRAQFRRLMRADSARRYAVTVARQQAGHAAAFARLRQPWYATLRRRYEAADMLLPNSQGESSTLRRELRVRTPMRVVPNGVDAAEWGAPGSERLREYVAYVGRIDPHKNQLGLIRALRGTGFPLVIAGPTHPHHAEYEQRCRSAARGQPVEFLPAVAGDELRAVYQGARVHAMPSFFETTGLASLEAAMSGCAVVSTREGWAKEYFGDLATYCRPLSRRSIRSAVERNWDAEPRPELRRLILEKYTWHQAARETISAYEALLGESRNK